MSKLHTRRYTPWNNRYWIVLLVPLVTATAILHVTAQAPSLLAGFDVASGILVALLQFALVCALINVKAESQHSAENLAKKLLDNEKWSETVLMAATDGFWMTDTQGRLLKANEAYCRMSGYSMLELLTKNISDFEVVESIDDITAHIQKVMIHGHDRFQTRHRRKDGSIFDVEYRADDRRVMRMRSTEHFEEAYILGGIEYCIHTVKAPLKNELGKVTGVLGIFMDITQRKQMEYELSVAHNDLENKVLERTKELDNVNAALMAEIYRGQRIVCQYARFQYSRNVVHASEGFCYTRNPSTGV